MMGAPARTIVACTLFLFTLIAVGCGSSGGGGGGGNDSTGGMLPTTIEPSIVSIQNLVFTPKCALSGCHTGPNPQNGLDLTMGGATDNLVNVPATWDANFLRVEAGNPDDSYLYMKLIGDPRIQGEPMPKCQPQPGCAWIALPADELTAIFDWINGDGAADGPDRPRPGY